MPCCKLRLTILLLLTASASFAVADEKTAVTDLAQVDEDFAYTGEFVGEVHLGLNFRPQMAVQVIALGDGKFGAARYADGLPGDGWNGHRRAMLQGQRRGREVEIRDNDLRITIHGDYATVSYPSGATVGELYRKQRVSPTMGACPPACATVLFDGKNTEHLKKARVTDDGLLMVGCETKKAYRDYTLHVEFRLPYMPYARGQGRSNSGVYLQSRYEVQILDSFALAGEFNECGSLYRYKTPDINMCFPPLRWQTYDIEFRAPRFDEHGQKTCNAMITVVHNGVVIHDHFEVLRKTGGGSKEGPTPLPIKFQDHGNPVHFRNVWIVDHSPSEQVYCCPPQFVSTPAIKLPVVAQGLRLQPFLTSATQAPTLPAPY